MAYNAIFEPVEDGYWMARVSGLPGALTQGETVEEAREGLREVIKLFEDDGEAEADERVPFVEAIESAGE